jgi:hypothetical protein
METGFCLLLLVEPTQMAPVSPNGDGIQIPERRVLNKSQEDG